MKFFKWLHFKSVMSPLGRFQWPRDLRHGSAAGRLLWLWVRFLPGTWMFVSFVGVVCCQVEVSAWVWSLVQRGPTECDVSEFDREASIMRRPWPARALLHHGKKSHLLITWYLVGLHATIRYEYWSIIFPYQRDYVYNSFRLNEIVQNT